MKILRILGVVAAVHMLAFLLIMAMPGCSTKPKAPPPISSTESQPVSTANSGAAITVPGSSSSESAGIVAAPLTPGETPAVSFDPNSVAMSASRYSPTRPGTPASSALQPVEPVPDVTPASTILVANGDSLWSIAKKHHITVAELAAVNNLKVGVMVHPGQKLILPSKATAMSISEKSVAKTSEKKPSVSTSTTTAKPAVSSGASVKHKVLPGESLVLIAKKYGVKTKDIAVANNIGDPLLLPVGKELIIPGWDAPRSSKTTKSASSNSQASSSDAGASAGSPSPVMPKLSLPAADQDLDAGLKSSVPKSIPVINIEDANAPTPAPTK